MHSQFKICKFKYNLIFLTRNQIVFTFFRLIWIHINCKMVNTIWFRVDLIRFRKYFFVCTIVKFGPNCNWAFLQHTKATSVEMCERYFYRRWFILSPVFFLLWFAFKSFFPHSEAIIYASFYSATQARQKIDIVINIDKKAI